MRRLRALVVPLLAIALIAGENYGVGRARHHYIQAYEHYTKHLVVYWDFETALNLRGTYLTDEFRRTMAEERQRLLDAPEADHQQFLDRLMEDGKLYHEVVFSEDSGLDDAEKFGTTDDGWVLRLIADNHEEKLINLYKVRHPNPLQRSLYPHFNIWSDMWVARFERTIAHPDTVRLIVASGYGNGELRWEHLR